MRRHDRVTSTIVHKIHLLVRSLIFDYHVVHNNTSGHDVMQGLLVPYPGCPPDDGKPSLEDSKGSFDILAGCCLMNHKVLPLPAHWNWDGLHERGPFRVDAVCKVVPHCVMVAIYGVVYLGGLTSGKFVEQMRTVKNIDVVQRPRHSEEGMPHPQVLRCNRLKNDGRCMSMAGE